MNLLTFKNMTVALSLGTLDITAALVIGVAVVIVGLAVLMAWWLYVTDRIWGKQRDKSRGFTYVLPEWEVDRDGVITLSQHIAESGYSDGELAGTSIWPWALPGSEGEGVYKAAMQGGVKGRFDNEFASKDGSRRVWRVLVYPLPNGGVHAVGFDVLDIITRAEAAEAFAAIEAARADLAETRVVELMKYASSDAVDQYKLNNPATPLAAS